MKLKKDLGLLGVFCISSGAMISSGLFVLPAIVYLKVGPAAFLAYFLAGILVIPSVLSKAELVTAMPKAGGSYFFIERSLGSGAGTLAGISAWFSLSFKSAFALLGIGAFSILLYPSLSWWQIKIIAVLCCGFFMLVNIVGVKEAAYLQIGMVLVLIVIIIYFIFQGIPHIKLDNFQNFLRGNVRTLFAVTGLVFVSYGGLTKVASIAEEVKNPSKNLPLGMLLSFIIITILYTLAIFVTVGVLGDGLIKANGEPTLTPLTDAANLTIGRTGVIILSVAALLAFISTANAGIMAASRSPMAMSKDKLLPTFFLKQNTTFKTPHNSILFTGFFMIFTIVFLDLEMLIKTASTLKILLFMAVNIAVLVMRESGIQNYQPSFKTPLYPWMQIFGIFSYLFLLIDMGTVPLLISAVFLGCGIFWYIIYGRIKVNKESALHHLILRILPKEFKNSLESELKEIIRERDQIQKDRFDEIIEKCVVLDLDERLTREEFFNIAAEKLSLHLAEKNDEVYKKLLEREKGSVNATEKGAATNYIIKEKIASYLGDKKEIIRKKLVEREEDSTTVITSDLAIPHILFDGEGIFEIMLIRCKKGIIFSDEADNINTAFIIAGSKDERAFHLKVISIIGKIVQDPSFQKRWIKASNCQALKDIILLAQRQRTN